MQRFKPGCGDDEFLRGGKPAARREEDHEEDPCLYHLCGAFAFEHHVVLGPGGGLFDEDFLLLRVAGRTHARRLHGLCCVGSVYLAAAKAVTAFTVARKDAKRCTACTSCRINCESCTLTGQAAAVHQFFCPA